MREPPGVSAFALDAVELAVSFTGELGPVPDRENDEFLGDDFPAGRQPFIECVGFVQLSNDAAGIGGAGRLQRLQGAVLDSLTSEWTSS